MPNVYKAVNAGSSPHPRGTPLSPFCGHGRQRFIPTPAGNPVHVTPNCCNLTVHPHTRGEPRSPASHGCLSHGSSPHPRGTHWRKGPAGLQLRFIPTPAGNPGQEQSAPSKPTVHPHTRGEPITSAASQTTAHGSSPHPRGTRIPGAARKVHRRFIPTPAGNPLAIET